MINPNARAKLFLLLLLLPILMYSQGSDYQYDISQKHPFGLPNPDATQELLGYLPLIGEHTCQSVSRLADQKWSDPVDMTWRFKFIMNGHGIQDETLKADGSHSGSIRKYDQDSARWYVHYFSSGSSTGSLPYWEGEKIIGSNIVLHKPQQSPNGLDGYYRLTFSDIDQDDWQWVGEWTSQDETIEYPTWRIYCHKNEADKKDQSEREIILKNIAAFSKAYKDADYDALANAYTTDGKIFPNGTSIIEGRDEIKKRWTITNGDKILDHQILPAEIKFIGDVAYDYGYYQGKTLSAKGETSVWKGKYVIVWKKIAGEWKIYLDIWNRVNQ